MQLKSKIIAIQNLLKDDSVGYGESFKAKKDMRIAVVACGYADGYPRHAPTGTPVYVEGKKHQRSEEFRWTCFISILPTYLMHLSQAMLNYGGNMCL